MKYNKLHQDYNDKKLFRQSLPTIIKTHMSTHEAFFVTFTFKDMKQNRSKRTYDEFFEYQRQKLDNKLLNNAHAYRKRPFFILIPELSPQNHYHGFLFIHKETINNFNRKCMSEITVEHCTALDKNVVSIRLNEDILSPYPKSTLNKNLAAEIIKDTPHHLRSAFQQHHLNNISKQLLAIADYRIHPIREDEEIDRVSNYCFKDFFSSAACYDDIIIKMKDKPVKKTKSRCQL
jgi:hypothetical protein